ncbi:MAG TPA: isoprenylcysteine carboxylmethyltransferase family protein [Gemmatimonadaceae bacterium]|nr:isoprenylcysteine carboxylmethyltransferase family protein [Gemmatimonadaceae bacterium]
MRYAIPRQLLSIAILPFVMTVAIPMWIYRRNDVDLTLANNSRGLALQVLGVFVLAFGIFLFVTSLRKFATEGEGTLAPWDPPRKLVVRGPYRHVRNPMISGVIFIIFGESLILLSIPHAMWALTFLAVNFIYIPLLEEPQLRNRFGDDYVEYCNHVPRLFPRLTPYERS